ncbi:AraC family transcriptional regulator [Asticcacaulis sp. 201]|uniref:AraC family transcriptional regulator n=1 Tax=Asticcacaulis sp. 201 TaxID=3028787 RepID=UPI0029164DF4|nr:AraC family transcriptional regulator [Asticcacaulis sp. 201]MDV6329434.1 AraC family transcriptional regulator [Asticcacaulis sp. 201]
MNSAVHPAAKALWFIENRFDTTITLDDIAAHAGVSRFHMTRVFDVRMGVPVMAYVRARRLSEAAKRLAGGAGDILSVALEAGYGSHEAFTRAFRDQFGLTPEQVRDRKSLYGIKLQEPFIMDKALIDIPSPHTLIAGQAICIGGLSGHYRGEETAAIPMLWQKFGPYLPDVPGRIGDPYTTYGVCYNQSDNAIDYMAGVEVSPDADLPPEFSTVRITPQTYARFVHTGHISGLRATWSTIWDKWLPESGLRVKHAPFFEKYGPEFNGRTGEGGVEIWIAVEA